MNRKDIADYRKLVSRCASRVDRAISRDICLSKEEWFDYLFKSAFSGFRSVNIGRYKIFHKSIVLLAESFAEALSYALDISVLGFKNSEYIAYIRRIIKRMNRFVSRLNRLKIEGYNRDGYLFIRIFRGKERVLTITVTSKEDAVKQLFFVIGYCVERVESISLSKEFTKFLKSYLQLEFSKIISCSEISPYVSGGVRYTLNDFLYGSYEDMVTGGKLIFT